MHMLCSLLCLYKWKFYKRAVIEFSFLRYDNEANKKVERERNTRSKYMLRNRALLSDYRLAVLFKLKCCLYVPKESVNMFRRKAVIFGVTINNNLISLEFIEQ